MALRSLGSSLLAKNQPGSASRKQQEQRILKPDVPGKGAVGSVERSLVEEPFVRPTPPGSEKVVSVNPASEAVSQASPGGVAPIPSQPGLLAGMMGQPSVAPQAPKAGSNEQALFQAMSQAAPSMRSAAAPTPKGGTAATARSGGALANAGIATAYQPQPTESVDVQAETPQPSAGNRQPSVSQLGGGVALGTGGAAKGKSVTSQIGNALRSVATAAAPIAARAGGLLRSASPVGLGAVLQQLLPPPPGEATGNFMRQKYGSDNFQKNVQFVQQAAQPVLRSISQAASNVGNNLRSAFNKFNPFGRR